MEQVIVWRGKQGDPIAPYGPLPGVRLGNVLAYEFQLADRFVPWPGRSRLERVFVLLDLGVSMVQPCWRYAVEPDGTRVQGVDGDRDVPATWYVDLVHISGSGGSLTIRDLYLDVMVPTDGRHQRLLDLEEFADAMANGELPVELAIDGLRRWQLFLDRHLHANRNPAAGWTDFPPRAFRDLAALPEPLGPIVTWP